MSQYIMFSSNDRYKTIVDHPSLQKIAEYQYYFFGKLRTTFTICEIKEENTRICIQGVSEVFDDNHIPLRVFPKFDSIKTIEKEIYELDQDKDSQIVKTL